MRIPLAALAAIVVGSFPAARGLAAQDSSSAAGRIAGRVVDRATGRPLGGARILVDGRPLPEPTNLDGHYRTAPLPAGPHTVQASFIGYQPIRIDSVVVAAGDIARADFALSAVPFEVAAIQIEAAAIQRPSSEAGLLAIQQAAPTVSDGISAEAMSRTPDADAADAVARVTGISVFDNKFVIVRGLPERYSNTLLNGAELVSPEPLRRVVPLDMFPANLLETIVTTKAATPDRPGDFAGGSVEIRTKDFPDEFTFQANTSQGSNSLATFERVSLVPRHASDLLGFDDGRRALPANVPATGAPAADAERFGESLRNVWTPAARTVAPDLGLGLNLGGRAGSEARPIGYVLAWTYSNKTEVVPERIFRLYSDPSAEPERSLVYQEGRAVVDWGAIANLSMRLGIGAKLAWRNLYTRTAEEAVIANAGFDTENARVVRNHQVVYTEQDFLQTQLSGEHQLHMPLSRFMWRATWARARRDEPDNRQAKYLFDEQSGAFAQASQIPSEMWARFLDDRLAAYQVDWAFPIGLRQPGDAELKLGGLYRTKRRAFDAYYFQYTINNLDPNSRAVSLLPPELAFAPENIGSAIVFHRIDAYAQSYEAEDRVAAAYLMGDLPVLPRVRLVGGARFEEWRIGVFPGGRSTPDGPPSWRNNPDLLWSANLTVAVSDRMNLRFAGFTSVARPDAREMSEDSYVPITGGCENQGNRDLERTSILNGDARWEYYPRPGEIMSISGFYKAFERPIIEVVDTPGGGQCRVRYNNGRRAINAGVELEVRRTLEFLPGPLSRIFAGVNLTLVSSRVTIDSTIGFYDPGLDLQGQSPLLVNMNLGWNDAGNAVSATLLFNYFADRIARYGRLQGFGQQGPDVIEEGRGTLDAKVQYRIRPRFTLSLSGRNLTDAPVEFVHQTGGRTTVAGSHRPGVGISLGVGYSH